MTTTPLLINDEQNALITDPTRTDVTALKRPTNIPLHHVRAILAYDTRILADCRVQRLHHLGSSERATFPTVQ
ncbi:hypothetical protein VP1G_11230 [Cytospora mali]|uniref:Uncharacterized protein n=1 Tax=Cytospora mali TaxID=578113 RepID=A0A194VAJ5_CYTMA|nr:hypothetical protein VP1G_11230 [Valsa mali var. pyri (nom. inval.)]